MGWWGDAIVAIWLLNFYSIKKAAAIEYEVMHSVESTVLRITISTLGITGDAMLVRLYTRYADTKGWNMIFIDILFEF